MRTFLVYLLLASFCCFILGHPQTGENSAKILKYNNDNDGLGSYKFEYETENGIRQAEEGKLKQIEKEEAIATVGNYEYSGLNGEIISVVYTADENGYRPKVNVLLLAPVETRAPPEGLASLVGPALASLAGR